jgi:hypothetical protein
VLVTEGFAEVRPLLKRADVLVCPRTSWSGFPIKLLNYMAAARPIVLSGGMGRSLGEGPWITVPDRDPASLAQAILRALGDPGLRARLEIDARRVVGEVYDWSRWYPHRAGLQGSEAATGLAELPPTGLAKLRVGVKKCCKNGALRLIGVDRRL